MPAVVHALPAWARGAEDTDPPPPRRLSCHISSTLTSFAVGGGQSPPTWLSPNLWPSPPPLGYSQMPFLLRGCGERQPPTARGSTHTHRGANEEGKRGQDSGPKDISPFRFPTHPARPPARDASGPGTVRSMSPGWGQWQGGDGQTQWFWLPSPRQNQGVQQAGRQTPGRNSAGRAGRGPCREQWDVPSSHRCFLSTYLYQVLFQALRIPLGMRHSPVLAEVALYLPPCALKDCISESPQE